MWNVSQASTKCFDVLTRIAVALRRTELFNCSNKPCNFKITSQKLHWPKNLILINCWTITFSLMNKSKGSLT